MVDSSDTRDFMRVSVACELVFKRIGDDEVHQAKTKDLSASGVSFVCEQALEPDDELEINVKPVNKLTPPLYVIAKVIRCESAAEPNTFTVACKIIEHID